MYFNGQVFIERGLSANLVQAGVLAPRAGEALGIV
jgi:hypothetical protein